MDVSKFTFLSTYLPNVREIVLNKVPMKSTSAFFQHSFPTCIEWLGAAGWSLWVAITFHPQSKSSCLMDAISCLMKMVMWTIIAKRSWIAFLSTWWLHGECEPIHFPELSWSRVLEHQGHYLEYVHEQTGASSSPYSSTNARQDGTSSSSTAFVEKWLVRGKRCNVATRDARNHVCYGGLMAWIHRSKLTRDTLVSSR